jgi:hypothetical protein
MRAGIVTVHDPSPLSPSTEIAHASGVSSLPPFFVIVVVPVTFVLCAQVIGEDKRGSLEKSKAVYRDVWGIIPQVIAAM